MGEGAPRAAFCQTRKEVRDAAESCMRTCDPVSSARGSGHHANREHDFRICLHHKINLVDSFGLMYQIVCVVDENQAFAVQ